MNYPMTLEQYMSQSVLTEKQLVRMGAEVANILAVIHGQMMIHGDVKPGNIVMNADGSFRLMGCGEPRNLPEGMYQTFLAPELMQGGTPNPATDIYALGMMMRELVSRQGVNLPLRQCIDKACAQEPQMRYARALDMAQELETIYEAIKDRGGIANDMPNVAPLPIERPSMPNMAPSAIERPSMPNMAPSAIERPSMPNMTPPPTERLSMPNMAPSAAQKKPSNRKMDADEQAALALRFVLPIMLVLIVVAAVVAYMVLIRPELKKDKAPKKTTTEMTASATDVTQEQTTTGEAIALENYVNQELTGVKSNLEALGLVVNVQYATSDDVEANYIISQSILQGATVQPGQTITLVVSEGDGCPEEFHQKVTVSCSSGSTSGTMTVYNWEKGDWTSKFSCPCRVGRNGVGSNYGEGKGVTPMGTFKLGYVLTTYDPGNGMKYKQVTSSTCVVDDVNSTLYNIICDSSEVPDGVSKDPIGDNITSGKLNGAIFIEHNGDGDTANGVVPGNASVITICGCNRALAETAGCIDISASDFSALLDNLDGNLDPHIEIKID